MKRSPDSYDNPYPAYKDPFFALENYLEHIGVNPLEAGIVYATVIDECMLPHNISPASPEGQLMIYATIDSYKSLRDKGEKPSSVRELFFQNAWKILSGEDIQLDDLSFISPIAPDDQRFISRDLQNPVVKPQSTYELSMQYSIVDGVAYKWWTIQKHGFPPLQVWLCAKEYVPPAEGTTLKAYAYDMRVIHGSGTSDRQLGSRIIPPAQDDIPIPPLDNFGPLPPAKILKLPPYRR